MKESGKENGLEYDVMGNDYFVLHILGPTHQGIY